MCRRGKVQVVCQRVAGPYITNYKILLGYHKRSRDMTVNSQDGDTVITVTETTSKHEEITPCAFDLLRASPLSGLHPLTPLQEVRSQFRNSKLDRWVPDKEGDDGAQEELDVSGARLREIAPFDDNENLG